ncbi:NAD(P)/FAD-dependent oxidoreductase [Actinoplanes sp. NPDC051343]|uniref:NAD(P)/FAD-dependent oxidoreductase n=1 Tax=Actinoplanes sp. NPDC051343 TaxID=3363906 RepID=UPI00378DE768
MTTVAVLGGGFAGMLAAAALSWKADEILVVEEDQLPDHPQPRKGVPQGHHSHMLMGGGADALESMLPGILDEIYAAGGFRRGMPEGMLTLSAAGWHRRHDGPAYVVMCSRPLLDQLIRRRVTARPGVTVLTGVKVTGLTGSAARVNGFRTEGGASPVIEADLIVDATGRRSKAPEWLAELGLTLPPDAVVDPGMAYATRLYDVPEGVGDDFPAVLIQPEVATGRPGRGATLFPIEGRRWIVTMCGTRGGEPPSDDEGYREFASGMRHPMIAKLIAGAEPIGGARPYRGTANRRRHFERLAMPDGFVAVGDAVAAMNPVYAHGMSVAALGVRVLAAEVASRGFTDGLAAAAQAGIAGVTEMPWAMASGQDLGFPGVTTNLTPEPPDPEMTAVHQRMGVLALTEPPVANAVFGMYTLSLAADRMVTPEVAEALQNGAGRPPLDADEAIAQFPVVEKLLS